MTTQIHYISAWTTLTFVSSTIASIDYKNQQRQTMRTMWKLCIFAAMFISAYGEKRVPGRFFSRPLFLRQEQESPTESSPYAPSGWKPSGNRLELPARQEASAIPHTVYGPPSTQQPDQEYGAPPQQQPEEATQEPTNGPPQELDNSYGPPEHQPQNVGYNYQPPEQPFPDPPTNEYGPPEAAPQEPDTGYGAPAGYNPPQENGQIPVEQGASERVRQQQFVQQLPSFVSTRFMKPQGQRLQQQQPKRQQVQPQRNQAQQQQPQRFQQQRLPNRAPNNQFAQKQQLYQTPKPNTNEDVDGPNVAVATAVSGVYYVIEPNGRLQKVSYTTKNGKLINGHISAGIRLEDVQGINAPIYRVNEFNQLIRIN